MLFSLPFLTWVALYSSLQLAITPSQLACLDFTAEEEIPMCFQNTQNSHCTGIRLSVYFQSLEGGVLMTGTIYCSLFITVPIMLTPTNILSMPRLYVTNTLLPYPLIYPNIHSEICIEYQVCDWNCSRCWGLSSEYNRK